MKYLMRVLFTVALGLVSASSQAHIKWIFGYEDTIGIVSITDLFDSYFLLFTTLVIGAVFVVSIFRKD